MKKELDEKLCADFPKIFAQRNLPMNQTCMCWGFDVGDGWYDLIHTLCSVIQNKVDNELDHYQRAVNVNAAIEALSHGDVGPALALYKWDTHSPDAKKIERVMNMTKVEIGEPPRQVEAVQVKEKFGGLRFYVNRVDPAVEGAIDMAEAMSYHICEVCGAPGEPNRDGWIKTLCKEHTKE